MTSTGTACLEAEGREVHISDIADVEISHQRTHVAAAAETQAAPERVVVAAVEEGATPRVLAEREYLS